MIFSETAAEVVGVIGPAPNTVEPLEFVVFKMDALVLQFTRFIRKYCIIIRLI